MSFVINRWVRGEEFFGRGELLQKIKRRLGKPTWVMGNRRVGKTSFLRQLEWLCRGGHWPDGMALYWDLQGAATVDGLKDSFLECLEDAEHITQALQLDIDELEDLGFIELISRFRRRVKSLKNKRFILLIDECEELVDIAAKQPAVLSGFRKLSHTADLSMVLAGSLRLMDLDESSSRTSPFLPDFLPPLLLGPFSREVSLELMTAKGVDAEAAGQIHELTFGNPHLVQILAEHYHRSGDLIEVLRELKHSKVCFYFFQSNFLCLPEAMRVWWQSGDACEKIAALDREDPNFRYLVQASLVRLTPSGRAQVSPLLLMVEQGRSPLEPDSPPIETAASETTAVSARDSLKDYFEALATREKPLSVLPENWFDGADPKLLAEGGNPPNLNLMASLGEAGAAIQRVLDRASPEYVQNREPTEKTSVYLMGLHLYRLHFGKSPFVEMEDPWQRAGAIGDRDVPIPRQEAENLSPKLAMIMTRCLKADPMDRYADLESLSRDVNAVMGGS